MTRRPVVMLLSLSLFVGLVVAAPQAALASGHQPGNGPPCVKVSAKWVPHHPRRDALGHGILAVAYLSDCGRGQELVRFVWSVTSPCGSYHDRYLVSLRPRHSKGFAYVFIPYCAGRWRFVAEARSHGVTLDRAYRRVRVT